MLPQINYRKLFLSSVNLVSSLITNLLVGVVYKTRIKSSTFLYYKHGHIWSVVYIVFFPLRDTRALFKTWDSAVFSSKIITFWIAITTELSWNCSMWTIFELPVSFRFFFFFFFVFFFYRNFLLLRKGEIFTDKFSLELRVPSDNWPT